MRGFLILILAQAVAALAAQDSEAIAVTPGTPLVVTREHPSANGREIFTFPAKADQTLLIEVQSGDFGQETERLQVIAPGDPESKPLASLIPNATLGLPQWINVLSHTGVYRIVIRPAAASSYGFQIRLLDPRDPLVDPGIGPQNVAVNLAPLGITPGFARTKFQPTIGEMGEDPWPASLSVGNDKFSLMIMRVDGLKRMSPSFNVWPEALDKLRAALQPGAPPMNVTELPVGGGVESVYTIVAGQKVLNGKSFRVLRWLGRHSPEQNWAMDPIEYFAEGLSRDGRYFVIVRADLSHPALRDADRKIETQHIRWDDDGQMKPLFAEIGKRLDAAPVSSFTPGLDKLDAAVRSITLH